MQGQQRKLTSALPRHLTSGWATTVADTLVTFKLPGTYLIDKFKVWNYNVTGSTSYGIEDFKILAGRDDDIDGQLDQAYLEVMAATLSLASGSTTYAGQEIAPATGPFAAKYVRFSNPTNESGTDYRGLSEVQFFGRRMIPVKSVVTSSTATGYSSAGIADAVVPEDFTSTAAADMWKSTAASGQTVRFDLGQVFHVDGMRVWNFNDDASGESANGVHTVSIECSTDDSTYYPVSDYAFAEAPGAESISGEDFDLDLTARYVRFATMTNFSDGSVVGLSEVVFFGEMLFSSKSFIGETTGPFSQPGLPYYCEQFDFADGYTKNATGYLETFNDWDDRWRNNPLRYGTACIAQGIRIVDWFSGTGTSGLQFLDACEDATPACTYQWVDCCTDDTDCCPDGSCSRCTDFKPPFENRPWADGMAAFAVGDTSSSLVIRAVTPEDCAPAAPKVTPPTSEPELTPVPVSTSMIGHNGVTGYGWHIFRAKFSNVHGLSQNLWYYAGNGFQINFEFLSGVEIDAVPSSVYAFGPTARKWGQLVKILGDGADSNLTEDYHLYCILVTPQVVEMSIDDTRIITWISHGMDPSVEYIDPRIQFQTYGFYSAGGVNWWYDPNTTEDGRDPEPFEIDYFVYLPLGKELEELFLDKE